PGRLLLRENGELVVLRVTGEQVWSAPAVGHTLVVTDAGRASLLGETGDVVWETPEPKPLDDELTANLALHNQDFSDYDD
ncbi:MAG: hypothetical protein ABW000_22250, partial [Actinoplanes sp.]